MIEADESAAVVKTQLLPALEFVKYYIIRTFKRIENYNLLKRHTLPLS